MGKVFTPEVVREGRLPRPGAHEQAGRYILEAIFGERFWDSQSSQINEWTTSLMTRGEGVTRGMIYGSTAMGTANIRSDVDTLLIYAPSGVQQTLRRASKLFGEVEKMFDVPIEHNLHPENSLSNPLAHNIDPLFASHIIEIQDQTDPPWSVNWPADGLHFFQGLDDATIRMVAVRYCFGKARQFVRAMADYRGEIDYAAYQRALELPGALGRKVLVALQGPSSITQELLQDKKQMSGLLHEEYEKRVSPYTRRIVGALERLAELDAEYTQLVIGCAEQVTSHTEHEEWLRGNYLDAIELAHQVASEWAEILERLPGEIDALGDSFQHGDGDRSAAWFDSDIY